MTGIVNGAEVKQPKSVYFHVPFCRHRCGYCNFSLVAGRDYLVDDWLRAIKLELGRITPRMPVNTIYFGGGTPSRLKPRAMQRLLELVFRHFELEPGGEFTMEANPEDLPGELAKVIGDSPINRISLGVQSFDSARLRMLDREHSPQQVYDAIQSVQRIVDRFSVDLIFGVPGDDQRIWQHDLDEAVRCGAGHVSTYELTIEKGTAFWNRQYHGQTVLAQEGELADLYEQTIDVLVGTGFEHYEISSFAKPGERSRHNQVYWNGASYWAFGPGAASLVGSVRSTNYRSVSRYLREVLGGRSAVEESQNMSPAELAIEQIVFGLRKLEGIDLSLWNRQTGFLLDDLVPKAVLDQLSSNGLLERSDRRIKLTRRGLMVGDSVCQQILNSFVIR